MHRDMALRLLKDRPGKKVMMTSYGPTLPPPQTFREFPENTIIEMMHSDEEAFTAWKQIKVPGGFSAYLYNWGNFHLVGITPLTSVSMIAEQNRLLVENNVHAVQVNGSPGGGQWGLEGPNVPFTYGSASTRRRRRRTSSSTSICRLPFVNARATCAASS